MFSHDVDDAHDIADVGCLVEVHIGIDVLLTARHDVDDCHDVADIYNAVEVHITDERRGIAERNPAERAERINFRLAGCGPHFDTAAGERDFVECLHCVGVLSLTVADTDERLVVVTVAGLVCPPRCRQQEEDECGDDF